MDESVKRRERLKAMRAEASQAEGSNAVASSASASPSGGLSNPFVESSGNLPVQEDLSSAPRFDFYTDPMAAFSGNRNTYASNQTPGGSHMARISSSPSGTGNPVMPPTPATQFHTNYLADQRIYHARSPDPYHGFRAPGPYHGFRPYGSPLGMASPLPSHQGTSPGAWNESGGPASYSFPSNVSTGGNIPSPGFGLIGSPSFSSGQGRGHWFGRGPSPDSGRGGSSGPNPGRGWDHGFGNNMSPGSGRGGSPGPNPGRGWDRGFGNNMSPGSGRGGSPSPNAGRGRAHLFGNNTGPNSGRSGGRGRGSHDQVSAQDRPDRFYSKSMVEDPWKFLEPVLWSRDDTEATNCHTPDSLKSWLPKSISKKARVSEASTQSNSQFNLAEYLADSFNEAVKKSEDA